MMLCRNIKIFHFYHFDSDPRFPPFLLYVRWKSGVTFVRRCFRDVFTVRLTSWYNIISTSSYVYAQKTSELLNQIDYYVVYFKGVG